MKVLLLGWIFLLVQAEHLLSSADSWTVYFSKKCKMQRRWHLVVPEIYQVLNLFYEPIQFATFIMSVFGEVENFVFLWQPLPLAIYSVSKDAQCSQTYAIKKRFFFPFFWLTKFSFFLPDFGLSCHPCPITSWKLITKVIIFRYFFCPKRCLSGGLSQLVIGHDWLAFLNQVAKMKILSIEKMKKKIWFLLHTFENIAHFLGQKK